MRDSRVGFACLTLKERRFFYLSLSLHRAVKPPCLKFVWDLRMSDTAASRNRWIINSKVDLSCFSLGWALIFFVPLALPALEENARFVAETFFIAHRYFTFPLVYLDRAEFGRRKLTYLITPTICIVGVWLCYFFRVHEPEMFIFWSFFNYFHFVKQKYGLLRIYSSKTGWGSKRLDELVVYGWGLAGVLHVLAFQGGVEGRLMFYLSSHPAWIYGMLLVVGAYWTIEELWGWTGVTKKPMIVATGIGFILVGGIVGTLAIDPIMGPTMVTATYTALIILTLVWLVHEFRSPHGANWPKILFTVGVAVMYGYGPVASTTAFLVATSFSHAFEYFAICGLSLQNKARSHAQDTPFLSLPARHIVLYTILVVLGMTVFHKGMDALSPYLFYVFIYSTSFMHFVYDGMIWRLRRPRVAAEVGA